MPKRAWIGWLSIWPGLAQIWMGQEVLGLLLGLFFAAGLNLAIVSRWVWTEAFAPGWSEFLTILAVLTWFTSLAYTLWWVWLCHPDRHRREIDRLFRDAMESYLQGRWGEARKRLERILVLDESDADTLMQLGTLYLRTDERVAARRAFHQCQEADAAGKWRWEVQQALTQLEAGGRRASRSV